MVARPDSDDPTTARLLGKTGPHGAQELWLVDQADKPQDSIFELRDPRAGGRLRNVALLGSELESVLQLYAAHQAESRITCQACSKTWSDDKAFERDQERADVYDNTCPACGRTAFNYPAA